MEATRGVAVAALPGGEDCCKHFKGGSDALGERQGWRDRCHSDLLPRSVSDTLPGCGLERSVSGDDSPVARRRKGEYRRSISVGPREICEHAFGEKAHAMQRVLAQTSLDTSLDEVSGTSYFLWTLFGASGWWSANAICAELPQLVHDLPAGARLGNHLSMMIQLGNLFLITYKLVDCRITLDVRKVIHGMMVMALMALVSCAMFWDVLIHGQSLPLLVFTVVAGGVGCMSNATYWALMVAHPPSCTKAMSIGMSLGGVLATAITTLQMAGRSASSPRFGVTPLFMLTAVFQATWWAGMLAAEGRLYGCLGMGLAAPPRSPSLASRLLAESPKTESPKTEAAGAPNKAHAFVSDSWPVKCFLTISFILHGITYAMPSLLPFVAAAYPEPAEKNQLLLWMLVVQQAGDSLGRTLAPRSPATVLAPVHKTLLGLCVLSLPLVFLLFFAAACHPLVLSGVLAYRSASLVIPALCLVFYFSYGTLQTFIFLQARSLAENGNAKQLASAMGFFGQMGALSANVVAFYMVNVLMD